MSILALSRSRSRGRSQGGATLIEAMVSILVLSFGLLGLAGLQMGALSYQKSAWSAHRVAEITSNFGERVRANNRAVDSDYQYAASYATGMAAAPTSLNCRTSGTCTPAQIAADDLTDLLKRAQSTLPQGSMQISGSVANGFVITAMYRDKDFTGTSPTCSASSAGMDWRNCCPAEASAPAGVRCRRLMIFPSSPQ